jgi:hypothetical protein
MKKLFSIILLAVLSLGVSEAQTVLYTQDFGGGIPANWGNSGTSNGVANSYAVWRYTLSGSHGAYGSPADSIHSPSSRNGWIIFDSDSLDNGGVVGNFGMGPAPAPQTATLTSSAYDVTGTPYCKLIFHQYFRNLQSTCVIGISTDSINWTLDTINASIGVNQNTAPNDVVSVDLSPVILAASGGPSHKVYISFIMDAYYYFWQIDDIAIVTLPNNDLAAVSATGQAGLGGTSHLGLFYSSIPASEADSFAVFGTYTNDGRVTQSNVVDSFRLIKNGTQIGSYRSTVPVAQLPYGKDSFDYAVFNTQGIGKYIVAVTTLSDSADYDLTNNLDSLTFAVTDSVFSINTTTTQDGFIFPLDLVNQGKSFRVGALFELDNPDTVTSVTTAIAGGSSNLPGTVIQATIYPVTIGTTSILYSTPAVSTYPKTLTAADISPTTLNAAVTPITLQIDNSSTSGSPILPAGVYWAAIGVNSTPDTAVFAALTHYQTNGFPVVEQNGTLFYMGKTDAPYCNLNFGHPSSILSVIWSRTPGTSPLKEYHGVTFTAQSNASPNATYAWTVTGFAQGSIPQAYTGKTFRDTFFVADSFQVCVTVTDGGNSASYCNYIKVVANTGLTDVNGVDQVSMIPNPSTGRVSISADAVSGPVSVTIVNLLGEVVKTFNEESNGFFSKSYNLSELSNGIYLVKIANAGSSVTKKLSISK